MNLKNFKIVTRITKHICAMHPDYDYNAVFNTIEHCFSVKAGHHLPDQTLKGILLIEDAIYLQTMGWVELHYKGENQGVVESYRRKFKVGYVNQDIVKAIYGTFDILLNASNINDIITQWKVNKAEAKKYYNDLKV